MAQKQFEYEQITKRDGRHETVYEFEGVPHYDFLRLLRVIGEDGWELVGEIEGKIIAKREIPAEDEE